MRVYRRIEERPPGAPAAWTIGNFDGVHLGHRHIVERLRSEAARSGVPAWALTFDPHPVAVLRPDQPLSLLTSIERRLELLEALGLDGILVTPFDARLSRLAPDAFGASLLAGTLGARGVVVGSNFRFGARRVGDIGLLEQLGAIHGFAVDAVEPVTVDGEVVSSTRVRAALARGDVADAARLLGRPHDAGGLVVEGQRRGRTLGFPTANLAELDASLPRDGVYACRVWWDGARQHRGVANLGVRPTVGAGRSVEVHVLDHDEDLYGRRIRVAFVARLRDERRFDGLEALQGQIARDVEQARAALRDGDPP